MGMTEADAITTLAGTYTIRRAGLDEIETVVDIIAEAAAWLESLGIDQWSRHLDRERTVAHLRTAMIGPAPEREVYLVWSGAEPVATLALQPEVDWGDLSDDSALYVHSFAVRRWVAGQGLGRRMLDWAAGEAAAAGKTALRLDCMVENVALRAYYERAGFVHRGDVHGTTWSASLYEKQVQRRQRGMSRAREHSMATSAGTLTIIQARPADLDDVVAIEEDASGWLRARDINPGEPPRPLRDIYADRLYRGEVYVAWLDGASPAMLTLQWEDRDTWGDVPDDAAYVHGLMVRRAYAGKQVGLSLLRWAEGMAAAAGRPFLRLDCQSDNPALRAYYQQAGFAYRGDVTRGTYTGSRYEKRTTAGGVDGPDTL
jgi:ribosomal protein S18 acetylase RimI-like enzyme